MIILGKVRPFSRPHAEAHPQVLIIAHEKTTKLLPGIDNHDVVVDAQHNVLQLLTLGTAVAVTLATARLWRGCRTS